MNNARIGIDRIQVRLRGGSPGSARRLAQALGPMLLESLRGVRGLRGAGSIRITQSGPADAGKIARAIAAALKRS